ncbi:MAG: amidohydrolase [Desulfobacteraceae bacterium]|nr:amidohydrolase [Desulfobacteraceae bacterium]
MKERVLDKSPDTLIKNGIVVTVNRNFEIIENGEVAVKDGIIVHAGSAGSINEEAAGRIIDAEGGIVMPGLVNTHTHLPMSLFRGLADDLPLEQWLTQHIFPAESAHINPGTVRAGTLLSCAEMLLSGTTTCCDGYFFENAVAEAVEEAGIRAVLGQGVADFPTPDSPDPARSLDAAMEFVNGWKNRNGRIRPSIFCHSPYTCSAGTLRRAKKAASEAGVLFQIHAAETESEAELSGLDKDASVIKYLADLGVLDENTLAAHCIWINAVDIATLHDLRVGVSHNPESNMKLASGIAPVPALISAGVTVGLGTDGCASNNNLDIFEAMDFTAKLHKASTEDPTVMDAETVVRMATIDGARILGLDRLAGSLEAGKAADIIIINTRGPHLNPMYHPESHLVYSVQGADVSHVMVGGELLVSEGRLVNMDPQAIMSEASEIGKEIMRTD